MKIMPQMLAVAAMMTPACAADDIAAVLTARKQAVIDAYNAADIDQLTANYTDGAWHISPRRPPAVGRPAIAAYFAPAMKVYTMVSSAKVLSIDVSGDTAVMISENALSGSPRPGAATGDKTPPAFTENRINLTVFKKQSDGRWLIDRFIDTTPPEPARPAR